MAEKIFTTSGWCFYPVSSV